MTKHNNCPEQFTFPARHLYAARNVRLEQRVADLDMLANTWMRAPGESVGTFALESAIDELAHEMKIDPIELRRRWEPERDPTTRSPHSSRHLVEGLHATARRASAGTSAMLCLAAGATANGFWAWAWLRRPTPTTACPA